MSSMNIKYLSILLLASFCVLLLDRMMFLAPVRSQLEKRAVPFFELSGSLRKHVFEQYEWIFARQRILRRVAELEQQQAEYIVHNTKLLQLEQENTQLRDQYKETSPNAEKFIPTTFIVAEKTFVPLGSVDGITEGAMIMMHGAFVGKVRSTSPRFSEVETVSNLSEKTKATIQRVRVEGLLTIESGKMYLQHVNPSYEFQEGDVVLTSGSEKGVLPNIPVAKVLEIVSQASDPSKTLLLEPIILPTQGDTVFVFQSGEAK